jgi:hypothetical protein
VSIRKCAKGGHDLHLGEGMRIPKPISEFQKKTEKRQKPKKKKKHKIRGNFQK